uniref:Uncharacterized protein n=1 Tax=Panagrolaimus superbus TaxID=310955 RepID=A0A914Z6Q6_9BILA
MMIFQSLSLHSSQTASIKELPHLNTSLSDTLSSTSSPPKQKSQIPKTSKSSRLEDADLLLYFNNSKPPKSALLIPSNYSDVRDGVEAFKELIEISDASVDEIRKNANSDLFLPEAISLSDLEKNPRNAKIYSIPKFFNPKSVLLGFGGDERITGVLPSKNIAVVKTIPLPFKSDDKNKESSSLKSFLKNIDKYLTALTVEHVSKNKEFEIVAKFLNKLNFQTFIKSSKINNFLQELIPSLYKNLQEKNCFNVDPIVFIKNNLPTTRFALLNDNINKIEHAFGIQTYYALMKLHQEFPSIFDSIASLLTKYRYNKNNKDFVLTMKKALNFKERLFQIANIYDEKTKGKKTAEECVAKAMEKLKHVLNFDKNLIVSEGNKTTQQLTDVEDIIVEDTVSKVSTLFPDMDEFYFIPRDNAFYEYLYHRKTKPFQLLSPEYFINKGRRANYLVPEVKWHISKNDVIVGYEIKDKFYPLVHRRKYFDEASKKYVFPPTAKVIDSSDPFFKQTHNAPSTKITHIIENQVTRFEEMENSFYKHFKKNAEISNEIHSIALRNTETFFPYIFRALQETFKAKMPSMNSNKRHFFEM